MRLAAHAHHRPVARHPSLTKDENRRVQIHLHFIKAPFDVSKKWIFGRTSQNLNLAFLPQFSSKLQKICQKKTNDTPLLHRRHCDYCCCEESTMSKPFDYSKWDNIELSDDEDDVHPNIDKESWFRMKHRSRVEREEAEEADKKKIHQAVR